MNAIGKHGETTSEYKRTKWAQWAAILLPILAATLAAIVDQGLITSALWAGVASSALAVLAAMGYGHARSTTKIAEARGGALVEAARIAKKSIES